MNKSVILIYLMTYGGAASSLLRPYVGLLVYVSFALLRPEQLWFYSLPAGSNFSRIVAIGLLIGWAIQGFGTWRFGRARLVVQLLIGYWLWVALGTVLADTENAYGLLDGLTKTVLPMVVGITLIDTREKVFGLLWTIVLSAGYFAYEANQCFYGGMVNIQDDGFGGLGNGGLSVTMLSVALVGFWLGMVSTPWWQKTLAWGSAALAAHTVLFSFSRGAMLGLLAGAITAFFLIPKKPTHYAIFGLAVAVTLGLAGKSVRDRFATTFADKEERDESAQSRLDLWQDCLDAIKKRPLLGVGPGGFGRIAVEYGWPKGKEAHCLWLQTAAEMGIPGALLLLAFYLSGIERLWSIRKAAAFANNALVRELSPATIPAIVGFIVAAQFVTCSGIEAPWYIALAGMATLRVAFLEHEAAAAVGHSGNHEADEAELPPVECGTSA